MNFLIGKPETTVYLVPNILYILTFVCHLELVAMMSSRNIPMEFCHNNHFKMVDILSKQLDLITFIRKLVSYNKPYNETFLRNKQFCLLKVWWKGLFPEPKPSTKPSADKTVYSFEKVTILAVYL